MEPLRQRIPTVLKEINHCIAEGGSFVLDRADNRLAKARQERKESYRALTKQSEDIARSLYSSKASDTPQVAAASKASTIDLVLRQRRPGM